MYKKVEIGRLALRHEGENWNAYYAQKHTMDGAIFIGSLSIRFAAVPLHKEAFMAFARTVVNDMVSEVTGFTPEWGGPKAAPESERSGHS